MPETTDIRAAAAPLLEEAKENASLCRFTRLRQEEDADAFYGAWRVDAPGGVYFLKKNKGFEREVYDRVFAGAALPVPARYAADETYSLYEFFSGESLCRASRDSLTLALDALLTMQTALLSRPAAAGVTAEQELAHMAARAEWLPGGDISDAYAAYLDAYPRTPAVFGHGDLLPFNVLTGGGRAVLIDWEYAGTLPYAAPLARLIAHGENNADALFCLQDADRAYAARYYGEHLPASLGVAPREYIRTLGLFVFAEYCEWVYLGERYGDTGTPRYRRYRTLADRAAAAICKNF